MYTFLLESKHNYYDKFVFGILLIRVSWHLIAVWFSQKKDKSISHYTHGPNDDDFFIQKICDN